MFGNMHIGGIIKMLDQTFWLAYGRLSIGKKLKLDTTKQNEFILKNINKYLFANMSIGIIRAKGGFSNAISNIS